MNVMQRQIEAARRGALCNIGGVWCLFCELLQARCAGKCARELQPGEWQALHDFQRAQHQQDERRQPRAIQRLGLAGGRKWAEIPDDEVRRIYLAVFAGDDRTDAEFDKYHPLCHCRGEAVYSDAQFSSDDRFQVNRDYERLWRRHIANKFSAKGAEGAWRALLKSLNQVDQESADEESDDED